MAKRDTTTTEELATLGAAIKVEDMLVEIKALHTRFPGLRNVLRSRNVMPQAGDGHQPVEQGVPAKRPRRKMSAAARKKISEAQKKRWAAQKAKK